MLVAERDQVEERRRVAQRAVRVDLERVQRPVAARREHPVARARCPTARSSSAACGRTRPRSSAPCAPRRPRRARRRARQPRFVSSNGNERSWLRDASRTMIGVAAHRVDRAVSGRDAAELRLELAHRHLVAPVGALLVRAVAVRRSAPGRRRSRPWGRRTARRACAARPGAQNAFASENASTSPSRLATAGVLGRDLAAAAEVEHAVGARLARELDGAVRRPVGGDDQLEPVARVVERERVARPCARSPPPRRARRRSATPTGGSPARPAGAGAPAHPASAPTAQRVGDVRVDEQRDRGPEGDLEREHRRIIGVRQPSR